MKRIFGMILMLLMINLVLTGCGKNASLPLPQSSSSDSGQYNQESPDYTDINPYPPDFADPSTEQLQENDGDSSQAGAAGSADDSAVDVDLTKLSSTMVFSEVYNMMVSPDQYMGKTVKAEGVFQVFQDPDTKKNYYAVVIADATACCQQGLEFIWNGDHAYPDDYPEEESEIEITGVFQSYQEDSSTYYYLLVNDVKPV